ncbi:hypothetical protein R1sor_002952 [Riccia sorocarpa]|uniref:Uncharacterized protein n=1 Tax=Riccia sorocarpa TaxID=122646 RepID=A0ABD3H067_9MARC
MLKSSRTIHVLESSSEVAIWDQRRARSVAELGAYTAATPRFLPSCVLMCIYNPPPCDRVPWSVMKEATAGPIRITVNFISAASTVGECCAVRESSVFFFFSLRSPTLGVWVMCVLLQQLAAIGGGEVSAVEIEFEREGFTVGRVEGSAGLWAEGRLYSGYSSGSVGGAGTRKRCGLLISRAYTLTAAPRNLGTT